MIPQLCQSLLQLEYPSEKLQLVLIDDASTDGTGQVMQQQAAGRPGWQVLQFSSSLGKAHALNTALAHSHLGKLFIFLMPITDRIRIRYGELRVTFMLHKWRQ